jgi:hypothetical protein
MVDPDARMVTPRRLESYSRRMEFDGLGQGEPLHAGCARLAMSLMYLNLNLQATPPEVTSSMH